MRPESYQTTQEEADTLVAFRAALSNGNVLVRASDADVLVILLHLVSKNVIRKLWIIVRFSWIVVFEPPGDTSMLIKSTQNLKKPAQDQRKLSGFHPCFHRFRLHICILPQR